MKTRIVTAAIVALAIAAPAASAHPHTTAVSCFSASSWSANDNDRPCTTVIAPDNDEARVIQGTATREEAECRIDTANINDARCRTIGANRAAPAAIAGPVGLPGSIQVACSPVGCTTTGAPQEDGSGLVMVHVGSTRVVCMLGNPAEEHGAFRVPCRLVG